MKAHPARHVWQSLQAIEQILDVCAYANGLLSSAGCTKTRFTRIVRNQNRRAMPNMTQDARIGTRTAGYLAGISQSHLIANPRTMPLTARS